MGWTWCATNGITVTFAALFLMAVGFSIPFWLSYSQEVPSTTSGSSTTTSISLFLGIWYLMSCVKGEADSCVSKAIEPDFATRFDNISFTFSGNTAEDVATAGSVVLGNYGYVRSTLGIYIVCSNTY